MNDHYKLDAGPATTAGLFFSLLSVFPPGSVSLTPPEPRSLFSIHQLRPTGMPPDPSRIQGIPHQIRPNTLPAHPGVSLIEAADGTIIDLRRSEPSVAAFRDEG